MKSIVYTPQAHKMLDEMHFFREKKFFCDVTLVVGHKEIEVSFVDLEFKCFVKTSCNCQL